VFEVSELVKARQNAEAASRAKDEFLAMLGHELRNPLAPILTAVQLMRLRDVRSASKELAVIERQARHLIRLVDDLLDVSRVTGGKIELKRERMELAEIVARAIETASPLLERQEHQMTIDVPPAGLVVHADPSRLAQVIGNLLTNAAKYTPKGGRISVTAGRGGGQIAITVTDTGIGIAPDVLPRVFDMFVQDRQALARSQGGLGLGLTIVRSITNLHGGTVHAHSEGVGHGSTFTVRLPAPSGPGSALADAAAPAPTAGYVPGTDGRRVLVVDDNEDAAAMLADALRSLGHAVRVAHDGASALEAARGSSMDLALLDIGLPVMDGYELARLLRTANGEPITLVAVTGYGQERDKRQSDEAGFDAHLVKPITIEMLKSTLERFGVVRRSDQ
jgi:CheY-like chemotaxis protein